MASIKVQKQMEGAVSFSKEVSLSGQVEFGNILMARHEMNSHNFIRYFMFFKKWMQIWESCQIQSLSLLV